MTSNLRSQLLKTCRGLGIEPIHLGESTDEADLHTALLKDSIDLREQGNEEQSLQLLDAALEAGLNSDWIEDNRARGLIALHRHEEAQSILNKLLNSADPWVHQAAESMLQNLQAEVNKQPNGKDLPKKNTTTEDMSEDTPREEQADTEGNAELTLLLEEAIALRENGDPQASLNLLDATAEKGFNSPWLDDNRARAFVDLNQYLQAHSLWRQLASSDDEAIAEVAKGMADQQHQWLSQHLLAEVQELAANHCWELQHLTNAKCSLEELEQHILHEAIASREADALVFSLELIELAIESSFNSPWLLDNKARVLLLLNRKQEAVAIWQQLSQQDDDAFVQQMAETMLDQLSTITPSSVMQTPDAELEPDPLQTTINQSNSKVFSTELSTELKTIIESAIALRDRGQAQASLEVIEDAELNHHNNAWLADNRARALVHLNRPMEALAIWSELASSGDASSIHTIATEMAEKQKQALLEQLQSSLSELACSQGWTLQHINNEIKVPEALEEDIIKETIASRDAGAVGFSLELIKLANELGFNSPWLLDNKARALLLLNRDQDAIAIWQQLSQQDDDAFLQQLADTMLEQVNTTAAINPELSTELSAELKALLEAAITLRNAGQPEASLTLLDDANAKGQRNAWLEDNRARALINLGREQEALKIWQSLAMHSEQGVANQAKQILAKKEADKLEELLQTIKTLSAQSNWNLIHIDQHRPTEAKDFEVQLLNEAIAMREKEKAALSLQILDLAIAADINGPWLQDNRARALVNLARRREALETWQHLSDSENPSIQVMAAELVATQKAALLQELQTSIRELAKQHGWTVQYVRQNFVVAEALEEAILKDAIAARDAGQAGFSLAILEQAIDSGMESPWLHDNQARALVHLDRKVEAVAIWRQLAQLEDNDMLREMAAEMLETYGLDAERQERIDAAELLMAEQKHKQAIDLLTDALLIDAEFNGYRAPLNQAIALSEGSSAAPDPSNPLSHELKDFELNLKSFDAFLSAMEQRVTAEAT